ncbi:glycoside hydrolase family 32 protein [Pseudomaricurvus alcaniphilus]|uniref:glycoside hydrolase family 32 protein n=1 Tax=Pseudomaricurvus alcaniphilus TaxID=1166482 RepID=UPI001409E5A8|nr:glycoside hydrolase family 32 protein [Pseudomaricurvus alcaniphilus]NHN36344.1 glycoside hydrolase family 32 protein [Pseudomaricurvus alcaniphilus]
MASDPNLAAQVPSVDKTCPEFSSALVPLCKLYQEPHRPQLHYSASRNWINDPNGLVYFSGKYHLFYQLNPHDKVWSNMSWGHAVSDDLVHWEQKPVALASEPDGLGFIYSGSVVVDWSNRSGFKEKGSSIPPLVAMFTHHSLYNVEVQSLAYSTDGGDSWAMYKHNPVIANNGIKDFRDPKVIWIDEWQQWVMVLASGTVIKFHRSGNMVDWEYLFDFGEAIGAHGGVWECPDLFPMQVGDTDEVKWVLLVSLNPGGPAGGSGTQYFVGEFSEKGFFPVHNDILWLDYGPDCYAGVTWSDIPVADGRRILTAWMSNWKYAAHTPTLPWRGAMTFPRVLNLSMGAAGYRLLSRPAEEIRSLQLGQVVELKDVPIGERLMVGPEDGLGELLEIEIKIGFEQGVTDFYLEFCNESGETLGMQYDARAQQLLLNRNSAVKDVGDSHAVLLCDIVAMPVAVADDNSIRILILKDRSSVEVFAGEGETVCTMCYFTSRELTHFSLKPGESARGLTVRSVAVRNLASIWAGYR